MTVFAYDPARTTNAQAIWDCRTLGYLSPQEPVLDVTYNTGKFWNLWRPPVLYTNDLDPRFDTDLHFDFTKIPLADDKGDPRIVFDPPYKYVGTSRHPLDDNYGINEYLSVEDRDWLICAGASECARILQPGGLLFVKVQDQVVSGKKRWQTIMVAQELRNTPWEMRLVDELHVSGYREQPARKCKTCQGSGEVMVDSMSMVGIPGGEIADRCPDCQGEGKVPMVQKHAASNVSTLMIFRKGK